MITVKHIRDSLKKIPIIYVPLNFMYRLCNVPSNINIIVKSIQNQYVIITEMHQSIIDVNNKVETMGRELDLIHGYSSMVNDKVDKIKPIVTVHDGVVLTKIDGFVMALPSEDHGLTASYTFPDINIETGLKSFLRRTIKEGMVFVDVGASIGIITLISGQLVGASGRVYSFEPTPRIFKLLSQNVTMASFCERVILHECAVMDRKGTLTLSLHNSTRDNSFFNTDKAQEQIAVDCCTLDEIIPEREKVDFVKIDAEGSEPYILKGMQKVIERNPNIRIVMEFAPDHLKKSEVSGEDFLREIREMGFMISKIQEPTGGLISVNDDELIGCRSENIFLVKE